MPAQSLSGEKPERVGRTPMPEQDLGFAPVISRGSPRFYGGNGDA